MNNRSQFIDIAKGIGISLVVLLHNPLLSGKLFNIVISFIMPLFFFLSGVFLKSSKPFKIVLADKFNSLLKPYFATLLPAGLVYSLFKGKNIIWYSLGVFYGNGDTIVFDQLWYLTNLFAVVLFSYGLIKIFGDKFRKIQVRILILSTMLTVGVFIIKYFWKMKVNILNYSYELPGLPFSLDIIFITSFYYLLGYFLSQYILNLKPSNLFFFICLFIFITLHSLFNKSMDLNDRIYDGIIITTIEALSGTYIILHISYYLQLNDLIARLFSFLGTSSIFILLFHYAIQEKAHMLLFNYLGVNFTLSALIAFIAGLLFPILLMNIIKKNVYLSIFFLPVKSNKKLNQAV